MPDAQPVSTPIYASATFTYDTMQEIDDVFSGEKQGFIYTRYGNPTTAALEEAVREVEEGAFACAYATGMAAIHAGSPERRDRLWLINAFAVALLTLLGATGEALGYDRMLKSNTTKRRTHSLFRQGAMLYDLIPNMPDHRLAPLMAKDSELIGTLPVFKTLFALL